MNGIKDQPEAITSEITIRIHLINGDIFSQYFTVDYADRVQSFMDWVRKPGKDKAWSWHVAGEGQIHVFRHEHIMALDIDGYIEPDGRTSKLYERWMDKIRVKLLRK